MKKIFILHLFFLMLSCSSHLDDNNKKRLWAMITSDNVDSIIDATLEIQEAKDTSMLEAVLYNANDPRISHSAFHKGMSVYKVKMITLQKITGTPPPIDITYKADTNIIKFYEEEIKRYHTNESR